MISIEVGAAAENQVNGLSSYAEASGQPGANPVKYSTILWSAC